MDRTELGKTAAAWLGASPGPAVLVDDGPRIIYANEAFAQLVGVPAEELVGRWIGEHVHPEDLERTRDEFQPARRGELVRILTRMVDASGGIHHVLVTARHHPIVGGIVMHAADLTALAAARREISALDRRLAAVGRSTRTAAVIINAEGRVTYATPGARRLLGVPDDVLGTVDPLEFVVPADRPRVAAARAALAASEPGTATELRLRVRTADGRLRWLDTIGHNLLEDPDIGGMVVIAHDVTDLVEAEQRFRSLAEASPLGVARLDSRLRCVYANRRWHELTGEVDPVRLWPDAVWRLDGHPTGPRAIWDRLRREPGGVRATVELPDTRRTLILEVAPLTPGTRPGWVALLADVTTELRTSAERYRLAEVVETAPEPVLILSDPRTVTYRNAAARELVGPTGPDPVPAEWGELWEAATATGGPVIREMELVDAGGGHRHLSVLAVAGLDSTGRAELRLWIRDVSTQRRLEARLAHWADHDPLTGLPNRRRLLDRLSHALDRRVENRSGLAVLYADLDGFSLINETLGHTTGDELLSEMAARIAAVTPAGDTVGRLGADEFVIVDEECAEIAEAMVLAERVRAVIRRPATVGGRTVTVTARVGVVHVGVTEPVDAEEVIGRADTAAAAARRRGPDSVAAWTADLGRTATDRMSIGQQLRSTLDGGPGRLVVHFQPRVRLSDLSVRAVEALVRWEDPEGVAHPPARFLDVATETGLIVPIGRAVLAEALATWRRWRAAGLIDPDVRVAVNVSPAELLRPGFLDDVDRIAGPGADLRFLEIEIVESPFTFGEPLATATLLALRERGARIAVDDFGTGYSSLAHLRRFPADVVKIDRRFVSGPEGVDRPILRAVVALARSLGLWVVAEGVETPGQAEVVAALGIEEAQGFLFARPRPADEALDIPAAPAPGERPPRT